jgi:6-phosphofructokinase 1
MEGEKSCLPHVLHAIKEKGHAVIVVAEGAGEELLGQVLLPCVERVGCT